MKNKSICIAILCIIILNFPTIAEGLGPLEVSGSYRHSYNGAIGHKDELFFMGIQNISENLKLATGFSTAFNSLPESFFLNLTLENYPSFLRYSVSLLSRDFPHYGLKENSLYPTISLMTKYFEMELGMSLRVLEADVQLITYHTLYRFQFNIIDLKKYGLILRMSNFDHFRAGNISDLYYIVENSLHVSDQFTIRIDMGLQNAGQLSFASYYSTFYGQIGVKYSL